MRAFAQRALAPLLIVGGTFADEVQLHPYAYQFQGETFGPWPENDLPELQCRASLGLAFSGGGTRAQIAALGQLRGLMDLGILEDVKYITGISGGSWAAASFVYATTPTAEYLGDLQPPEDITMESLGKTTGGVGRYFAVDRNLIAVIAETLLLGYDIGEVWYRAISQVFLEPAGIKWGSFFSWSDREVADITRRNPSLADKGVNWATVRDGTPFLISTATLTGPECSKFIRMGKNKSETLVESTPLYVGEAHTRHEIYRGFPQVKHQVGGYVEPFAFGAMTDKHAHLPNGQQSGLLDGVMTNQASCGSAITPRSGQCSWPWALGHAVGASSWAPGLVLSSIPIFQGLDLDLPYWSPATPLSEADNIGDEGACGRFILADGGCTSNIYISGLIKRGVKTVIAFVNTGVFLAPSSAWDPTKDNRTNGRIDDAFGSFFGMEQRDFGEDYQQNQIFDSKDFVVVVQALQASQAAGVGAVATMEHTTLANPALGILAGLKVKMVWVYLTRAYKFEDAIRDPDVKTAAFVNSGASWDPRDVPKWGTFWNFPRWDTFLQLQVNKEQANLMSHMQAWIMKQHSDVLKAALAYAREGVEKEEVII